MRVVIAARLSRKAAPGETVEFPIEAQDRRAREWAEAEGHEVVGTAADFKSGTVAPWDRKNLRPWVRDADKLVRYDAIVVYRTDRISRGTDEDFSRIEAWAADHHKRIIVVGPGGGVQYPARDDSDYWQWAATKRQARKEWEDIRSRTMNRQADLLAAGKFVGRPPFGYTVEGETFDKHLVPTAEGREYVPQIYQRVTDGQTLLTVCKWLDSEGVHPNSRQAVYWSPKSVSDIIRNRVYIGERTSRKTGEVLLQVEPLVDPKLWLTAIKALEAPKVGRRGPVRHPQALLTGYVFCGKCGAPMYQTRAGKDPDGEHPWWTYYRCYGLPPQRKGCGTLVAVPYLDQVVGDAMRADRQPVLTPVYVSGDNHDSELARVQVALNGLSSRGLDDDAEDAERKRLRAERDRLRNLPATEDHWELVAHTHSGEEVRNPVEWALRDDLITNADAWEDADFDGRRKLLETKRITFRWSDDKDPVMVIAPVEFTA